MKIYKTKRQEKLEKRRLEGCRLLGLGQSQAEVARRLKVSPAAVCKWNQRRQKGTQRSQRPACTQSRLTQSQRSRLDKLLRAGAARQGYADGLWTLARVARLIDKILGVHYSPSHVWRILRGLGWSCQKPVRRAMERDEQAILHWKERTWPLLKKKARAQRRVILFLDESGLSHKPHLRGA
ncbi:MAG: winged helix-turn-helix domain-containing protein [Blastochloris sp.]|nr:winged helix-turn-helix domain-containing protein [Blastochloris sp.]